MKNETKNIQTEPVKTKGLRMPYEKTWAQAIILALTIFCLIFLRHFL